MQNEPAPAFLLQVPKQPLRVAPGSARRPLSAPRGAPASGVSFLAPLHPHPPGYPQLGARRKSLKYGAKLYSCNRLGIGKTREGGGGRARLAQAFSPAACPGSTPSSRLRVTSFLSLPTPPQQSTHSCHARVAGGAPREQPEPGTPPRLPFPQHRRACTGAARRGGTQGPPNSPTAVILPTFPPRGGPGRCYPRQHVHVPRRPLCPSTAGNWQETLLCGRQ